jgi:drug/metabolite transporter (DMT)-like permease
LFTLFAGGSVLLFPAYVWENQHSAPVHWNSSLTGVILYLGIGTSVISYLCWNAAIGRLGAARTALFGNLIPLFASLEALILLHEKITFQHLISGILVITGLLIANLPKRK